MVTKPTTPITAMIMNNFSIGCIATPSRQQNRVIQFISLRKLLRNCPTELA